MIRRDCGAATGTDGRRSARLDGQEQPEPLRILTGQTASGKSAVAVSLAKATGGEIISVDSIKVYRGLDIGTAKPSRVVRKSVPFHLVDIVEPQETFTLARYLEAAREAAADIATRGHPALYVGGTPLYLRGLLYGIFAGPGADWDLRERLRERAERQGPSALHEELRRLDPATARRLHPNDLRRIIRALEVAYRAGQPLSALQRQFPAPKPAVPYCMVALRRTESDLHRRIDERVDRMFASGIVDEVRGVMDRGGLSRSARKAIGYREVLAHLNGEMGRDEAARRVKRNTWRLARKQRTWLKSFPGVRWLDVCPEEAVDQTMTRARELLLGPVTVN